MFELNFRTRRHQPVLVLHSSILSWLTASRRRIYRRRAKVGVECPTLHHSHTRPHLRCQSSFTCSSSSVIYSRWTRDIDHGRTAATSAVQTQPLPRWLVMYRQSYFNPADMTPLTFRWKITRSSAIADKRRDHASVRQVVFDITTSNCCVYIICWPSLWVLVWSACLRRFQK